MDFYGYRIFKQFVDLEKKHTHLWLYGERNTGKTTFIEKLMDLGINVYHGPYNNDWVGFN